MLIFEAVKEIGSYSFHSLCLRFLLTSLHLTSQLDQLILSIPFRCPWYPDLVINRLLTRETSTVLSLCSSVELCDYHQSIIFSQISCSCYFSCMIWLMFIKLMNYTKRLFLYMNLSALEIFNKGKSTDWWDAYEIFGKKS